MFSLLIDKLPVLLLILFSPLHCDPVSRRLQETLMIILILSYPNVNRKLALILNEC